MAIKAITLNCLIIAKWCKTSKRCNKETYGHDSYSTYIQQLYPWQLLLRHGTIQ